MLNNSESRNRVIEDMKAAIELIREMPIEELDAIIRRNMRDSPEEPSPTEVAARDSEPPSDRALDGTCEELS